MSDAREQRSRLEALQVELRAHEQQRAELQAQLRPARHAAEAAEAASEAVQSALWKARMANAKLAEDPLETSKPPRVVIAAICLIVLALLRQLLE